MVKKVEFEIEKEIIDNDLVADGDIDEPPEPPAQPAPTKATKQKKPYVFSEARQKSLEKGRNTRKLNMEQKRLDLAEFKEIKKQQEFDKLTANVKKSINDDKSVMAMLDKIEADDNSSSDEEPIIKKKKVVKNKVDKLPIKKKKKKIVYISESESESESEEEIVYRTKPKPKPKSKKLKPKYKQETEFEPEFENKFNSTQKPNPYAKYFNL